MDLGTANTLIIHNDEVVVNEPSIVALNRNNMKEVLAVGKKADFACYAISCPAELCYQFGVNSLKQLIINGKAINHRL